MILTKSDIAENLFEKLKLTKQTSKKFVEFFFSEINISLEKGEDVKLSGFGKFTIQNKKSRPGRNFKTGKNILITARRVVTFKASQKLKNIIDNYLVKKNISM